VSIEYSIICDNCGRVLGASSFGAWDARDKLSREGVQTAVGRHRGVGRFDYCAECVKLKAET
jgi:hypothetical protein